MITIDLRKHIKPLVNDIRKYLATFAVQHPKVAIHTIGLYGDGFHGTVALYLDTVKNSRQYVQKNDERGTPWYGEDEKGKFCMNCGDFEFQVDNLTLSQYPDFYTVDESEVVEYVALDGTKVELDREEGNEGYNAIVFPFLREVIASLQPFSELTHASIVRVLVQMHDSEYEEAWILGGRD